MEPRSLTLPWRNDICFVGEGASTGMHTSLLLRLFPNQKQHPFLHSWQKDKLQGLVSFVTTWTKQSYRYLGWQDRQAEKNR